MSNHVDTAHDLPHGSRSPLSQRLTRGAAPEAEQPGCGEVSQRLLWSVLKKEALDGLPARFRFCEADQSSWWSRILADYPASSGVAVLGAQSGAEGRTPGMCPSAEGRFETVGNLAVLCGGSFDVTLCLGAAMATAERPEALLGELVRVTKPHGIVAFVVPNLYHAIACNLARAHLDEAQRALQGRALLVPGAGDVNVFTPRSVDELVKRAGACPRHVLGLPAVSGISEDVVLDAARYRELLATEGARQRVLAIEEMLLREGGLAARGNQLLAIATVRPGTDHWGDFWLTNGEPCTDAK